MSEPRKILAIINPISGTGSKEGFPHLVENAFASPYWNLKIAFTQHAGHATQLAAQAAASCYHAVLAIGGDGTVNEVGSALCGTATAMGIVPCGSGNGLARHLGIPLNVKKALNAIAQDHITAIDYIAVNDRKCFCTCGVGFDAEVSHTFAQSKKRGFATYVKNIVNDFFTYEPQQYEIEFNGTSLTIKALVITFCNASQYGNNAIIAPSASVADGLIDMTTVSPVNTPQAAVFGIRLITHGVQHDSHAHFFQSSKFTLHRAAPGYMHIDGDPLLMPQVVTLQCVKGGLQVLTCDIKR